LDALRDSVHRAKRRLLRGDPESARTMLPEGLRTAQQGGWNIWEDFEEAREAFRMMLVETGCTEQGLKGLAELIMCEDRVEFWRIARVLIVTLMPALEPTSRREIFSIVLEHVGYLVKPERAMYSVAGELDSLGTPAATMTSCECIDAWL